MTEKPSDKINKMDDTANTVSPSQQFNEENSEKFYILLMRSFRMIYFIENKNFFRQIEDYEMKICWVNPSSISME